MRTKSQLTAQWFSIGNDDEMVQFIDSLNAKETARFDSLIRARIVDPNDLHWTAESKQFKKECDILFNEIFGE